MSDEERYIEEGAAQRRGRKVAEALVEEMGQMLLSLEWSGRNSWSEPCCPSCGGDEKRDDEPRTGHYRDCALRSLLIVAKVRRS